VPVEHSEAGERSTVPHLDRVIAETAHDLGVVVLERDSKSVFQCNVWSVVF
jgi:hypothetical protein